jgi:hypothetical protein
MTTIHEMPASLDVFAPSWIETASDVQLHNEHSRLCRWFDMPNCELWAEQYAAKNASIRAIWAEMALRASRAALPGSAPSRKEASRPSRAAPANARKVA